jgi:hypothetical protein
MDIPSSSVTLKSRAELALILELSFASKSLAAFGEAFSNAKPERKYRVRKRDTEQCLGKVTEVLHVANGRRATERLRLWRRRRQAVDRLQQGDTAARSGFVALCGKGLR